MIYSKTFRSFAYIFEVIKKEFGENSIEKGNFVDLGSVKDFRIKLQLVINQ